MQTVLGAGGPIADELTRELYRSHTQDVRLVSRHPTKVHDTDELVPADLTDADATDRAVDSWVVAEALSRLSQDHREVIVRSYYGGHSTQQIAAELDIPEGTVKSRMHYGMRALRLAMQELGVTK